MALLVFAFSCIKYQPLKQYEASKKSHERNAEKMQ